MSIWHEARKHEKKIRGIMVDYRKRAERRREFYESIRRDPASYLQIHGQAMKVHIDPAISQAADSSLVPWMGDPKNLIDRFDVRAHLDYIPTPSDVDSHQHQLTADQECQLNYERYRNLIHNDYLGLAEAKVLNQIYLEERGGGVGGGGPNSRTNAAAAAALKQKSAQELKKRLAEKRAAIGFNYDELNDGGGGVHSGDEDAEAAHSEDEEEEEDALEEEEEMDTPVDVAELTEENRARINSLAGKFGVHDRLFTKFSNMDREDAEKLRIAKELENEKLMFVGRKSRRERKELKQQRMLILRSFNCDDPNDHFGRSAAAAAAAAAKKSSESESDDEDDDLAKAGPIDESKVEFITSFGHSSEEEEEEEEEERKETAAAKPKPADLKKEGFKKKKKKKQKSTDNGNSSLVFGPMLPSAKEIGGGPSAAAFKFNSSSKQRGRQSFRYSGKNGSDDDDDNLSTSARSTQNSSSSSMTPQERLRRLMQAQLDKEYKRDKKAAQEKLEKQKQEQLERDEELTKMNRVVQERYAELWNLFEC
ncbi:PREDICTED: CLK4-associating serine/arginine rich protein-like [Rhagoletis zephyria]|uniref:CLK4-associating serine/arginine rich protein-like n=1 Tax=Rhagoletis zephyria TaxID=28612 RepID=UPI000811A63A|nr:PREDICTED: CLK4-associating serine/arginine rich protein-like [Rhagoletis zephyria]